MQEARERAALRSEGVVVAGTTSGKDCTSNTCSTISGPQPPEEPVRSVDPSSSLAPSLLP